MIYVTLNFSNGFKVCSFKARKIQILTQVLVQVLTQVLTQALTQALTQVLTEVKPALGYIYATTILNADYYCKTYSAYAKHRRKADHIMKLSKSIFYYD